MAGKRLTCPMCRDTVWMSEKDLEEAGGSVQCANHWVGVEMVDLAALMEILGAPKGVGIIHEEVDFSKEDMNVLHPDDFDFSSW